MEDRPQYPVGKAVVVFLEVGGRQIERDDGPFALVDDARLDRPVILDGLAAPSKPHAIAPLQCGIDRDSQAAGLAWSLGVRDRYPVRNYDKARHHTSSHLTR